MADAEISIVAELVSKVDSAVEGFNQVANSLQSALDQMRDQVNAAWDNIGDDMKDHAGNVAEAAGDTAADEFGEAFGGGIAAAVSAAMLDFVDKVKNAVDETAVYANRLSSLKIETGDSEANLQKLQYAFASVGVSSDSAGALFARFQRAISSAADQHNGRSILERMGLDPKQMRTQDITTNLALVSDKISNLKEASQKSAAAVALFGRAGYSLLPALDQGGKALKEMAAQAEAAGVILPQEMLDRFDALHSKTDELEDTAKAFYARFAAPFVNAFLAIDTAVQHFMASFRDISDSSRLGIVFGALGAGVLLAEHAFAALSETLTFLKPFEKLFTAWAPGLNIVIIAVGILAQLFSRDIGGIRALFEHLGTIIVKVATDIGTAFNQYVAPALSDLLDAFGPLIQIVTDLTGAAVNNKKAWSDFKVVVADIAKVIRNVVEAVADVIKNFDKLKGALIALGTVWLALNAGAVAEFIIGLIVSIPNAIEATIAAFTALRTSAIATFAAIAAGEDVVFPPMLLWQALILLIGGALAILATHWDDVNRGAQRVIYNILGWLATLLSFIGQCVKALADVIAKVPGLNGVAEAVRGIGNAAETAATFAQKLADGLKKIAEAKHDTSEADFRNHENWDPSLGPKPDAKPDVSGDAGLGPVPASKSGSGEATTEAIEKIKNSLQPLKDAIAQTEYQIARLSSEYKLLGDINTPKRLAEAEANLAQQVRQTNRERIEQIALAKAADAGSRKLKGLAAGDSDQKTKRDYQRAGVEMEAEANSARLKALDMQNKMVELKKQEQSIRAEELNKEEDKAKTYATQIAILEKIINLGKRGKVTAEDALAAEQKKIEILKAQAEYVEKMANAHLTTQENTITAGKTARDTQVTGPDPTGAIAYAKELADAEDEVTLATLKETSAKNAVIAAQQQVAAAAHSTEEKRNAAAIALVDAENNQQTATNALTAAQQQLLNKQLQTDASVIKVREGFVALAQQAVGPLFGAFQAIINGGNPLVTLFQALFQQTGSFKDIMAAFKEITQAVAEVFDALRPVIDFFLGILIGIVNVFIVMYNVIVELLDVFGLGIQKIKLLTTNLNNLNQAVPLLQITHDVPTANEYNAGKWGPLIAKQEETNNTLNAGFNSMATKLGEMAGTLLGIRMVLYLMMGQGILGQNSNGGGLLGMFTGLFNKITGGGASGGAPTPTGPDSSQSSALTSQLNQNVSATTMLAQDQQNLNASVLQSMDGVQINTGGLGDLTSGTSDNTIATAANTAALQASGGGGGRGGLFGSLSGILPQVGMAMAALGVATTIFGGAMKLFGPKLNAKDNPDLVGNTAAYGQFLADYQGASPQVGGKAYTADAADNTAQGGTSIAEQMSTWLQNSFSETLTPSMQAMQQQLLKLAGGSPGGDLGITSEHQGMFTLGDGVKVAVSALESLTNEFNMATQAAGSLAGTLGNAADVNLASMFGNGVSTVNGGYSVQPGEGSSTAVTAPTVSVTIGNVHGTDAATASKVGTMIATEVQTQLGAMTQRTQRNSANAYGRDSYTK